MAISLVFETHSTSEDNEAGRATGWLGGQLSEAGREQAVELGRRRQDDGIDVVFSSDLARARETVAIAFKEGSVPVLVNWRLRECDYGTMNGGDASVIRGELERRLTEPFPGGESWQAAIGRVQGCVRDLVTRYDARRVLVVGHMATHWGIAQLATGRPLREVVAAFEWQPGWEYVLGT